MNSFNIGVDVLNDPNFEGNATENSTNQRGITLTALIITIIALLILAGVSISLLAGENSIIGKANEAKSSYNIASQNEADTVNGIIDLIDENEGGQQGPTFDSTKVSTTVAEGNLAAPIPVGYVKSEIAGENTIAGGLVIYEKPAESTIDWTNQRITIGENTTNLQETVDQYVWIPVEDVNDMVMCKSSTGGEQQCNLVLENGTLVCETHNNSTDLCGRLYGVDSTSRTEDGNYIYQTEMNFEATNQTFTTTGWREPDILTDTGNADGKTSYLTGIGIVASNGKTEQEVFADQLQNDFNEMAKSVAKYKGFYIGRYEAGAAGATKKNQKVLTAALSNGTNHIGANRWYGLYNTIRDINQPIVDRHMIWRKPV